MKSTSLACALAVAITLPALAEIPEAITPKGVKPAMTLKGAGTLTYECRTADGKTAWAFAGPDAKLTDGAGKEVGKYYAGPTWEHKDGSKVTGKQVATAPGAAGAIPLQLVEATPGEGKGEFAGVTHVQRINTAGGVAPADPCDASKAGEKKTVAYSADYVFFKK